MTIKRVSIGLVILLVLMSLDFLFVNKVSNITVYVEPVDTKVSQLYNSGGKALKHLKVLSDDIGQRVSGSENEKRAADYILGEFESLCYENYIQNFTYTGEGKKEYSSRNIIAMKPGRSTKEIIVGAHYDSVPDVGLGADDNASGVGVMLEVAELLKDIKTPYTIRFIAFGSEEVKKEGSEYYVSQMNEEDIRDTIAMINIDSIIAGDKMYVHGGAEDKGWVREFALDIAKRLNITLERNPGLNKDYPEGTTGDWGDHAPFETAGIPYANFEATNWEIGDLDGYTQTVKHGKIWHTEKDTLEFIEAEFEGRVEERLCAFVEIIINVLIKIKEPVCK